MLVTLPRVRLLLLLPLLVIPRTLRVALVGLHTSVHILCVLTKHAVPGLGGRGVA